ncbi:MAG: hypothetical protein M0C28_07585 [Candidatus Moduliflexus flocculans]|nr:hypothetical protein [Candidatus Moduliflexus flocculans]
MPGSGSWPASSTWPSSRFRRPAALVDACEADVRRRPARRADRQPRTCRASTSSSTACPALFLGHHRLHGRDERLLLDPLHGALSGIRPGRLLPLLPRCSSWAWPALVTVDDLLAGLHRWPGRS